MKNVAQLLNCDQGSSLDQQIQETAMEEQDCSQGNAIPSEIKALARKMSRRKTPSGCIYIDYTDISRTGPQGNEVGVVDEPRGSTFFATLRLCVFLEKKNAKTQGRKEEQDPFDPVCGSDQSTSARTIPNPSMSSRGSFSRHVPMMSASTTNFG